MRLHWPSRSRSEQAGGPAELAAPSFESRACRLLAASVSHTITSPKCSLNVPQLVVSQQSFEVGSLDLGPILLSMLVEKLSVARMSVPSLGTRCTDAMAYAVPPPRHHRHCGLSAAENASVLHAANSQRPTETQQAATSILT